MGAQCAVGCMGLTHLSCDSDVLQAARVIEKRMRKLIKLQEALSHWRTKIATNSRWKQGLFQLPLPYVRPVADDIIPLARLPKLGSFQNLCGAWGTTFRPSFTCPAWTLIPAIPPTCCLSHACTSPSHSFREWDDRNRALRNEKEIMSRHYAHLKSGMDTFRASQASGGQHRAGRGRTGWGRAVRGRGGQELGQSWGRALPHLCVLHTD